MAVGAEFDAIYQKYPRYPGRFQLWCGFDYTGYDKPGFGPAAVKELERCYRARSQGSRRIGGQGHGHELRQGCRICIPTIPAWTRSSRSAPNLGMPVSLHVADPIWMYEKMDKTNDGSHECM